MPDFQWDADDECWKLRLSNRVFDDLEIRVTTDGESNVPTPKQIATVETILKLTEADRDTIAAIVRKWAEDNWDAEQLEDMEDEEFEYEITSAVVPRLRDAESEYFIFIGSSELDPEHGLGCICRDGSQFAICHSDQGCENYEWDSVDELDALLS